MSTNLIDRLDGLSTAQDGYFTRAQAVAVGIEDFELTRATKQRFIERLGHGVYRVSGAGYDRFEDLRVAWIRLAPELGPRQRTLHPRVWVSHESAAAVHGFGDLPADRPTFIVIDRIQPGRGVKLYRRSGGLDRHDWIVRDGFAVTSVNRTFADLRSERVDGGHLGGFLSQAVNAGATELGSLSRASGVGRADLRALMVMGAAPETE